MLKQLSSLVTKNTVLTRCHLTPELVLRLVTPACPLWWATEDRLPFKDPYWAFYWPGGQAMARYILDSKDLVKNMKVLDIGCGCGAGAIAASKMNAKYVVANDIDPLATTATLINAELNDVSLEISTDNYIGSDCKEFDTILIGDMFYDEEFGNILFEWLQHLKATGKSVLIGDPGRHGLTQSRRQQMVVLAKYKLPNESCIENNGFTETSLWKIK